MNTPEPAASVRISAKGPLLPLYAAGFVTAFGAHSIAASLGGYTRPARVAARAGAVASGVRRCRGGAQAGVRVAGRPDRARPVLLGGLLAFAVASAGVRRWPAIPRCGRAWPGSARALPRRRSPRRPARWCPADPAGGHGRAFGRYGAWKGLGYTLGPLLGGVLITAGGYKLLFATLAVLARRRRRMGDGGGAPLPPLPRARQTVLDLARRLTNRGFLRPTLALAAATGGAVGRGGLPAGHRRRRVDWARWSPGWWCRCWPRRPRWSQPWAGRARDARPLVTAPAWPVGLCWPRSGCARGAHARASPGC